VSRTFTTKIAINMTQKAINVPPKKFLFHSQTFLDKTICKKITSSAFWTEELFGINLERFIDKAIELKYVGGCLNVHDRPSKFLCLLLKMIQMQPEESLVISIIKNANYKYVSALALLYWRLTAKPADVYVTLEPFLEDWRKLAQKNRQNELSVTHVDEFVDSLLREELFLDVNLPRLPKRQELEGARLLKPRVSPLAKEMTELAGEVDEEGDEAPQPAIIQRSDDKGSDFGPRESLADRVRREREKTVMQTRENERPAADYYEEEEEEDEEDEDYWTNLRKKAGV